ncbi:hypothetical protein PITCH_A1580053 [uncultured Desulfobacterium sp.]|uniref:Uncharacterized protein n=1 Tax=uncultured Desulfobacterium sp. TaxID=201089 RepID=A0A445MTW2_9BACT|nr:hypothetical protein PITCH_A1580053 [uncultured Desulfobacterium sp.]
MVVQGPFAGNICGRSQKTCGLFHSRKTVKEGIDVISAVDPVDQSLFNGPVQEDFGMWGHLFRIMLAKENGKDF